MSAKNESSGSLTRNGEPKIGARRLPRGWKRVTVGFKVMLQGPNGLAPDDGLPVQAYGSVNDRCTVAT